VGRTHRGISRSLVTITLGSVYKASASVCSVGGRPRQSGSDLVVVVELNPSVSGGNAEGELTRTPVEQMVGMVEC